MSQQQAHFLQVEAVNIYATVFDTDQLSVIRGGSFLIADAMVKLADEFKLDLKRLSTGASAGLYLILRPGEAEAIRAKVIAWLRKDPNYHLFTFAVAQSREQELCKAKPELATYIRYEQLCQLTIAPDSVHGIGHQPCALSGTRACRPGQYRITIGKAEQQVSPSVWHRLRIGRLLKTAQYLDILGAARSIDQDRRDRIGQFGYAPDLEQLARSPSFNTLNNKIAVIYLDGNGFGTIQNQEVKDAETQRKFDDTIRQQRAEFLATLLEAFIAGSFREMPLLDTQCTTDVSGTEALRLETLLWGGDEMTLVVPAWLGFAVMQLFYACAAKWDYNLTYAGGLVFCHAHTPIARMRHLAQDLAEGVKDWMKQQKRQINGFDYMVLESIDYPVETDLTQVWERRYGPVSRARTPLQPKVDATDPQAGWFGTGRPVADRLLTGVGLSRGQVFRLARQIAAWRPTVQADDLFGQPAIAAGCGAPPWDEAAPRDYDALTPFERLELRLLALTEAAASDESTIRQDLLLLADQLSIPTKTPMERAWLWLHLAELWDYLVPQRDCLAEPGGEAT